LPEVFQIAFSVLHQRCLLAFNPGLAIKAFGLTYTAYQDFHR
jgi:hypothetical protein